MRTATDHKISYAAATASELMFNSRIATLHMAGMCTAPQDVITLSDLQEDIFNAMVVNPTIAKIAVFFPAGGFVLDNSSCIRKQYLENWCMSNYDRSLAEMKKLAFEQFTVGKLITLVDSGTGAADILYIKTLGNFYASDPQPVLLITLKGANLASPLKEYEALVGAPSYLVTQDGIVLDSSFRFAVDYGKILKLSETEKAEGAVVGPDKTFVIQRFSSVMNAKYISIIPNALYLGQVNHVTKVLLILLAVFIGIGLLLAIFFSRRSSTPLEKMARLLRSSGQQSNHRDDEYDYIERMLGSLISEKKLLEKSLDAQKQEMKDSFLARLTKGNVLYASLHDDLEHYNIDLDGDLLIATAYTIENYGPYFSDGDMGEQMDLLLYSVRNTAEELMLNKFDCYVCKVDDKIICVASSSDKTTSFFDEVLNIVKTAVDFFAKKLNVELVASVSHAYPGLASIPHAYVECIDCLEYRTTAAKTDRVIFSAQDREASTFEFGYSVNAERLFINCIKSADYQRATIYLDEIIGQCKNIKSLPLIKVKMAGLVSSVLTALMEFGTGSETEFFAALDPAKHLLDAKNIDDLADQIRIILNRIMEHTEEKSVDMADSSIESIVEYLRSNYADPLLSISAMAEKFSFNRSYLSQKFKVNTAMSPLEYLNKIRIEKAKEMIRHGASNFAEIAAACGYYDNHALNVAFKKYEGVPPTKYRMSLSRKEGEGSVPFRLV